MPGIARVFEKRAHGSESALERIIEILLARLTAFAALKFRDENPTKAVLQPRLFLKHI